MLLKTATTHQFFTQIRRFSSQYNRLGEADVRRFQDIIGSEHVVVDPNELIQIGTDWTGRFSSRPSIAVYPRTTEQISAILKHCHERKLPIIPQGGKTGLVGGAVPKGHDEIILGLKRFRTIESMKMSEKDPSTPSSFIVECEAGVVLEELDQYLSSFGCRVPLDLGAKGSCQIGGNISTNAGGTRYIRYGSLHGNVLGIEAVLADGTILRDTFQNQALLDSEVNGDPQRSSSSTLMGPRCNTLRKDNVGYDLKQLFIGSEGTLGIVTRVVLLCPPKLAATNVVILAANSFADCVRAFQKARRELAEILSAFEFFDQRSLSLVLENIPNAKDPLPQQNYPFYCLLETSGSQHVHDQEKLTQFIQQSLEQEIVVDGTIAQDALQAAQFWKLRESITVALSHSGKVFKYDLSLPLERMYDLVELTRQRLAGCEAITVGYGHLGDANLHLNVLVKQADAAPVEDLLEPFTYEWTRDQGGSISAEHGLGQMKAKYLEFSKPKEYMHVMKLIKSVLDPHHILNPGKIFPLQ